MITKYAKNPAQACKTAHQQWTNNFTKEILKKPLKLKKSLVTLCLQFVLRQNTDRSRLYIWNSDANGNYTFVEVLAM